MNGLLALIASNSLNAVGLLGLRHLTSGYSEFLKIIFWGYALCGLLPFLLYRGWRLLEWNSLWLIPWASALISIYYLYANFPHTVSFSQLVVIQCSSPFLAVIFRSITGREKIASRDWKNALPLLFLLVIACLQWDPKANPAVLLTLSGAYLVTQISGRNFASAPRTQTLQLLNTATFCMIFLWVAIEKNPSMPGSLNSIATIIGFAILLYAVQYMFLFGLKNSPAVLSALGVSSTVPIGIILEAFVKHQQPPNLVFLCITGYLASIFWIAISRQRSS